jgi:hypothetical protein
LGVVKTLLVVPSAWKSFTPILFSLQGLLPIVSLLPFIALSPVGFGCSGTDEAKNI